MAKTWDFLKEGDVVDVIAPGYSVDQKHIEKARKYLESLGLKANIPDNLNQSFIPYLSNRDEIRFEHLKKALNNKSSKAIWCIRGGYGSVRLLPFLSKMKKPQNKKLFIGFSDATNLLTFLSQKWKWPVIHGPHLKEIVTKHIDKESIENIENIIFGNLTEIKFDNLIPLNKAANKVQKISGKIIGGNLSCINNLIGTLWKARCKNKILFLEEAYERGYSLDRMFTHLLNSKTLHECRAIVIGDVSFANEEGSKEDYSFAAIQYFANHVKIPVLRCNGIGHGETNLTLPIGVKSHLSIGEKSHLKCKI